MPAELMSAMTLASPEMLAAVGALVLLMVGVFAGKAAGPIVTWLTVVLLAVIFLVIWNSPDGAVFGGAYVNDAFARLMKLLTVGGAAVTLAMSVDFAKREKFDQFEFPVLVLLSTLGMMLMVSANNLLALYMGLELSSLALYVIAAIDRDNVRSTEAGLKYFVLGSLSSGMLLYGISLVYGFTGQIGFAEIATALSGGERQIGFLFGLVFVLAGLAFKISAVPFHMWTPDVYEGAPDTGHRLLCRCAENGCHGHAHPGRDGTDLRRLSWIGSKSSFSSRLPRWRLVHLQLSARPTSSA